MNPTNGAEKRVTENELNRLQEDLNRAFHKLSVATGHDTRCQAAAIESAAAKRAAADEVGRLQLEQARLTATFHEQRAPEFGIKPSEYVAGSGKITPTERAVAEAQQQAAAPIPIEVGDFVRHADGGPEMKVDGVIGDEVECSYKGTDGYAIVFHKPAELALVRKRTERVKIDDTAEGYKPGGDHM